MPHRLKAGPLEAHTKGEIKRLRHEGKIPVSVQHKGQETLHFQEEAQPVEDFIHKHGTSALIELEIEPGHRRETVLVHDVQRDPVSHRLLQVTYQSVNRNEKIKTHIPIMFRGEPESVAHHTAVVQHQTEEVEVSCLPADLPSHLAVDISSMTFGDVLRVADLPASDRYEILTSPDTVLASLTGVAGAAAAEEALAEDLEEPTEPNAPGAAPE